MKKINGGQFLLRFVQGAVALLILVQLFMLKDTPRYYLSRVDRLEGTQIPLELPLYASNEIEARDNTVSSPLSLLRKSHMLSVKMIKPASSADVFITINGKQSGNFSSGMIQITVFDNDYVEIDTSRLSEKHQFVVKVPDGVSWPVNGLLLEGNDPIIEIGRIKLR